ncbi:MAG: hypothetical protein KDK27_03875 [Leptospiraceae bacterium]|nr:hypothetical protein [Leptospiraceae bacterium]
MRFIRRIATIFVLTVTALAGCRSLEPTDIPDAGSLLPFDPLRVELAWDVFGMRVDMRRQTRTYTTTRMDSSGQMITEQRTEPVPYHYLGVDLGNGLFLDANLNLGMDIIKLFELENKASFTIVKTDDSFFGGSTTFRKNGNRVTIDHGTFGGTTEVDLLENGATFRGGWLSSDQDIRLEQNGSEIVYDPHGIFGSWSIARIYKTDRGTRIPGFWNDSEILLLDEDNVRMGNRLSIERKPDEITIHSGLYGGSGTYHLRRSANRIVFYPDDLEGFRMDFSQRELTVYRATGGISTYTTVYSIGE